MFKQIKINKMDILKTYQYKGCTIDLYYNGIYSCFITGSGYLKADTLTGIKKLINANLNNK